MQLIALYLPTLGKIANIILFTLFSSIVQLGPAFLIFEKLRTRFQWEDKFALIVVPLTSGVLGFVAFWAYFANPTLGKIYSFTLYFAAAIGLWKFVTLKRDSLKPIAGFVLLAVATAVFHNGVILMRNANDSGILAAKKVFLDGEMPHDNVIPYMVATRLYYGTDPRDVGSTWRSSDRPPLQSGMWLAEAPLFYETTIQDIGYHTAATFLQCFWVFAFALLYYYLPGRVGSFAVIFGFAFFSSFFHVNTVYVWPKLLAASFSVITLILLIYSPQKRENLILAGLSIALSLLSHGGTAFSFLALLPWWSIAKARGKIPSYAFVLIPLVLLFMPWSLYQKYYDPPGDRLVKMHLAGVGLDEPDPRSSFQALKDSYSAIASQTFIENRKANFQRLWDVGTLQDWVKMDAARLRPAQFFSLFHALAILNFGFILLLFGFADKSTRQLVGISVVSIVIWVFLMFMPRTTVIHQGSYLPPLLLTFALANVISQVFKKSAVILVGLNALCFFIIFYEPSREARSLNGSLWMWVTFVCLYLVYRKVKKVEPPVFDKYTVNPRANFVSGLKTPNT